MSAAGDALPRFLDAGEAALVVEFGEAVDPVINDRVVALDAALAARRLWGILETVPTYRSLMIHYDPLVIDRGTLIRSVADLAKSPSHHRAAKNLWTIPCCYETELAEDLGQIAALAGLSRERVVDLHSGASYRLYMYGFAPGFSYLGGIPEELAVSRRASPRPPHPPNVILVAGGLSLIATVSMPTGWWIIGTTPERMFSPTREPVFLAEVGDMIRFEPIDRSTFDALEKRATLGETVAKRTSTG